MRNAVEKGPDVQIKYPVLLPAAFPGHGQRVMGTSPGTITVAVAVEDRLHPLLQQHGDRRLRNPVRHIWDGDFILPLLQSCLGWIWFLAIGAGRGAALMVRLCQPGPTFLAASAPLAGFGLAGGGGEVGRLPDPCAASGLNLVGAGVM